MFGWWSRAEILASLTNISANAGSLDKNGKTRLIATGRTNPSTPRVVALNTSAMPPPPSRSPS
jgi:hypothetical protein